VRQLGRKKEFPVNDTQENYDNAGACHGCVTQSSGPQPIWLKYDRQASISLHYILITWIHNLLSKQKFQIIVQEFMQFKNEKKTYLHSIDQWCVMQTKIVKTIFLSSMSLLYWWVIWPSMVLNPCVNDNGSNALINNLSCKFVKSNLMSKFCNSHRYLSSQVWILFE
jgi:hypothetical protein